MLNRSFPSDIVCADAVKSQQRLIDSRSTNAKMDLGSDWVTSATPGLAKFVTELDMFSFGAATYHQTPADLLDAH